MTSQTPAPRIAIVGAGIIGLAHAVAALDAGYRVTVLEQDAAAVTASVRNFGHVCASVQYGELGELAAESLPIWLSLAERAGVTARRSGTLAVARSAAEQAVLEELVAERAPAGARLLTGGETAVTLHLEEGSSAAGAVRAGLLLTDDVTADPRTAVARIAAWVNGHERGEVRFATTVHAVHTGVVETNRGRVEADHIIVATGHLLGRLFPEIATAAGVRECALQMARVRPPRPMGLGPAVLTGTSMLRYGRFAGSAADALRAELFAQRPEFAEITANVMFTQQADGTLLVGDSHASHDAAPPFLDERWSQILLDEVATLLGTPRLEVLERWQGLYATSELGDICQETPVPGVSIVTLTTGVGMTVGLGLGARTIAALSR